VFLFRSPRILLAIALSIGAVIALPWDREVSRLLNVDRLASDLRTLVRLSETFGHGFGVAAIVISVGLAARSWRTLVLLGSTVALAGFVANLIKLNVARLRPYAIDEAQQAFERFGFREILPWRYGGDDWLSHSLQAFPSGHSAIAAALAVGLSRLYPHASLWFALLAALAVWQRIASQAHHLSDTLAGAAIGIVVATAVSGLIDRKKRRATPAAGSKR